MRLASCVCRDLVDASIGQPQRLGLLIAAASIAVLGLLLFALLLIATRKGAAIGILTATLIAAGLLALYQQAMEHFIEGVDLTIDACKCVPCADVLCAALASHCLPLVVAIVLVTSSTARS